jgi:transcription initiation factor IIE alpha subunit
MNTQDPVLEELRKISKILTLAHGEAIEKDLSKIATSDERRKIWVLIDGVRTAKEIAREVGINLRSVNRFLSIAARAGLVDNPRGKPPKRTINYVPPSWIELVKIPEETEKKKEERI